MWNGFAKEPVPPTKIVIGRGGFWKESLVFFVSKKSMNARVQSSLAVNLTSIFSLSSTLFQNSILSDIEMKACLNALYLSFLLILFISGLRTGYIIGKDLLKNISILLFLKHPLIYCTKSLYLSVLILSFNARGGSEGTIQGELISLFPRR